MKFQTTVVGRSDMIVGGHMQLKFQLIFGSAVVARKPYHLD